MTNLEKLKAQLDEDLRICEKLTPKPKSYGSVVERFEVEKEFLVFGRFARHTYASRIKALQVAVEVLEWAEHKAFSDDEGVYVLDVRKELKTALNKISALVLDGKEGKE